MWNWAITNLPTKAHFSRQYEITVGIVSPCLAFCYYGKISPVFVSLTPTTWCIKLLRVNSDTTLDVIALLVGFKHLELSWWKEGLFLFPATSLSGVALMSDLHGLKNISFSYKLYRHRVRRYHVRNWIPDWLADVFWSWIVMENRESVLWTMRLKLKMSNRFLPPNETQT